METEIKEIVDYFVSNMLATVPRFKVNVFAEQLSNSLSLVYYSEDPKVAADLPKNNEQYWIFREGNFVCPLLLKILSDCAISPLELLSVIPENVYFKIGDNLISSVCGSESKVIDLTPFKKVYFEIPLRILKIAVRQRISMLMYQHGFDGHYPNNFIPLLLLKSASNSQGDATVVPSFQAVGLPMHIFSAEQLNRTTFGSHSSAQTSDIHGSSGDSNRLSLFSESHKVDFFAAGWWERILNSPAVDEYAVEAKTNENVYNVLSMV